MWTDLLLHMGTCPPCPHIRGIIPSRLITFRFPYVPQFYGLYGLVTFCLLAIDLFYDFKLGNAKSFRIYTIVAKFTIVLLALCTPLSCFIISLFFCYFVFCSKIHSLAFFLTSIAFLSPIEFPYEEVKHPFFIAIASAFLNSFLTVSSSSLVILW